MVITVDPGSPVAPFEQIRVQVSDQARSGALPAGTRLPTVRGLAGELGLAPNTVARAYRELETDGVIETRGRSGSYVAAVGDVAHRAASEAALDYARRAQRLGLTRDEAITTALSALEAVFGRQGSA
ncbi:GntR family transcriptional regulator [Streptomyces sp. SID3343]|uniref:GntR family transcriptional regulator n=1 Tax=Streptomyces sp. SID3343 TaxID=2690260 RepID=UPI0013722893|nr:GntR family transcriptional regulator [Streptomyces sp. SID3343]MYV98291.1 GntR family transcriptional regulator [Streptomyces sp. SID3343]MYW04844.1 GntR family transcriptional regulator [Streptomyces sp. SID3343]